tara:strand:- start:57 stop:779 length:723 start_codon:yes stop_codon:yes gene_type:complete
MHENGHFLSSKLSKEIRYAGYLGQFSPSSTPGSTNYWVCSKGADIGLDHPVVGKYAINGSCYADKLVNTDVLALRRADFEIATTHSDETRYYLQSRFRDPSDINGENYKLAIGGSTFDIDNWINSSGADIRQFHRKIYYVRDDNVFVEKEIVADLNEDSSWSDAKPLADGVENFQVLYGFDTTDDRIADAYLDGNTADIDWENLVSLEFTLLMQAPVRAVSNRVYQQTIQIINLRLRQPD